MDTLEEQLSALRSSRHDLVRQIRNSHGASGSDVSSQGFVRQPPGPDGNDDDEDSDDNSGNESSDGSGNSERAAILAEELALERRRSERLTLAVEQLVARHVETTRRLERAERKAEEARERAQEEEKGKLALREVMMADMSGPRKERRDRKEKEFWSKMAGTVEEELDENEIAANAKGELPPNFCDPAGPSNPFPAHFRSEIAATRSQLRKARQDLKAEAKLRTRLDKENAQLRAAGLEGKRALERHRKELVGAARRIYHLLERQRKLEARDAEREKYIGRLEAKMLELTRARERGRRRAQGETVVAESTGPVPDRAGAALDPQSTGGRGTAAAGAKAVASSSSQPAAAEVARGAPTPKHKGVFSYWGTGAPGDSGAAKTRGKKRSATGGVSRLGNSGVGGTVASSDISSSGRAGMTDDGAEGGDDETGFLNAVADDLSRNDVDGFQARLQSMMYDFYGAGGAE